MVCKHSDLSHRDYNNYCESGTPMAGSYSDYGHSAYENYCENRASMVCSHSKLKITVKSVLRWHAAILNRKFLRDIRGHCSMRLYLI